MVSSTVLIPMELHSIIMTNFLGLSVGQFLIPLTCASLIQDSAIFQTGTSCNGKNCLSKRAVTATLSPLSAKASNFFKYWNRACSRFIFCKAMHTDNYIPIAYFFVNQSFERSPIAFPGLLSRCSICSYSKALHVCLRNRRFLNRNRHRETWNNYGLNIWFCHVLTISCSYHGISWTGTDMLRTVHSTSADALTQLRMQFFW